MISSNVVGYAGYKSYGDKPYSKFKPCQTQLDRDYYSKASQEPVCGERNLENYHRFKSDYGKNTSEGTKVGDYVVPSKDANTLLGYDLGNDPALYQFSRRAKYDQAKTGTLKTSLSDVGRQALSNQTTHWQSQSHGATAEVMAEPVNPSSRPVWSYPRAAYSSKRSFHHTEYTRTMGIYGHNPRVQLGGADEKHANVNDQLSIGTTKVTNHIPGYNGFLPKADFNSHALGQTKLDMGRDTILKQNIVENYSIKVPGYAGHVPMSSVNDRGARRPECLSTGGETFH